MPIYDSVSKKQSESNKTLSHKGTEDSKSNRDPVVISISDEDEMEIVRRVGPDDFMPLKMLGSGSFGEVYLVRENSTGELYAMKVLKKQKIFGNNLVRYAKTERDVLSYTKHPFIVGLNYAF